MAPEAKAGDKPFYISVHYTAPHSPWGKLTQPPTWYEYYKDCNFDSVPFEPMHKNAIFTCESPYFAFGAEATEVEPLRRELLSGYFGAIAAMDEGIGKIMAELEAQGIRNDTIVVFTFDNGMNTGHHGIWGKGNGAYPQNMYDTSVKIPFILYDRSRAGNGKMMENLYSRYDFLPTLVEMLDLRLTGEEQEKLAVLPGSSFLKAAVGDSAGTHLLSLYCTVCTNPDYAAVFPFRVPASALPKAVALNCGAYDVTSTEGLVGNLIKDFLPKGGERSEREFATPLNHINSKFPPAFIATACKDFVREDSLKLKNKLDELGVFNEYHMFKDENDTIGHVFHLNIRLLEAQQCNDMECGFFQSSMTGEA